MSITDWDQRLLCGDGACVGVIGPDGQCKVCKRVSPNWGDDRRRGLKTTGEIATKAANLAPVAEAPDADAPDDADEDDGEYEDDDATAEASAEDADVGEDDDDGDDDDGDDDDGDGDDDDDDDDDDGDKDGDGDEDPADEPGSIRADASSAVKPTAQTKPSGGADWQQRELCSNGACIGVIGDDGNCKTCGTAA